jgi:hypothetical protein
MHQLGGLFRLFLWQMIQYTVDQPLDKITLYDMANNKK